MSTQVFLVEGMSCKNCKTHVETGIKNVNGVEEVVANHVTGQVVVKGDHINEDKIKTAVEETGYRFKGAEKMATPGSEHWLC